MTLTVAELISALQKYDPTLEVQIMSESILVDVERLEYSNYDNVVIICT